MKKYLLISVLLVLLAAGSLSAQVGVSEKLGIGFILGQPTGVSVKYWFQNWAIDGAVAWAFPDPDADGSGRFSILADLVYHLLEPFDLRVGRLPVYVGAGAMITLADDPELGLRIPVGMSYLFPVTPLEIFGEVAPGLTLLPESEFNLSGGVGFRFYF